MLSTSGLTVAQWEQVFRVDLEVEGFIALINTKGYRVNWRRWAPCPCVRGESRQPRTACPLCRGRGDRFLDSLEIRALIMSLGAQKEFQQYSEWYYGTATLTLHEEDRFLAYRDRFDLLDSLSTYAEFRQRDSDVSSTTDYLQYDAVEVVKLFRMNDAGTAYIDLVDGTDFQLNSDGSITWLTSSAPAAGSFYSIVYTYHPSYQVIDLLNDVRDTYVKDQYFGAEIHRRLPQRALLKRTHLLQRTEQGA